MTTVFNDRPNRSVENRQMEEAWKIKTIEHVRLKDPDPNKLKKKKKSGRGSWDEVEGGCTRRGGGEMTKLCGTSSTSQLLRAPAEGDLNSAPFPSPHTMRRKEERLPHGLSLSAL